MSPFHEHLLQRDIFENVASQIIKVFETEGALDTYGGSAEHYFESFETAARGKKAPEGHIFIKTTVFRHGGDDNEYILVPMDLLDEVYVMKIDERAREIAQKAKAEREAELAAHRASEEAKRVEKELAQLRELQAKHPGVVFKTT